ncbi:transposase [Microbacterium candidum]|uniref:Transposase n=1 Tax=Microbacterium candidum TaxID=3041922 RepID=A0ABT7N4F1_9MICO|nr:transposase [Microbacterium sp. ASV49]MDL9981555.1 transposase [Microbacterium sp. ASV49]
MAGSDVAPDAALARIAAELYAGPLDEFVSARNAQAKHADDRELAAQIRALRKPSVAAWIVDVFAQERGARLGEALQLAAELREAQADLDAPALAELGRQRRALTDQLARDAVALASARGGQVTPSTAEAVRQTIAAAFFDADAAAAVASGRLVRELEASGVAIDLDAVVGGGPPTPMAAAPPTDEMQARRERRAAEVGLRDAEQALLRAKRDQSKADGDALDLTRRIEELSRRERELEAGLVEVRAKLDDAQSRVPDAESRRSAAEAAFSAAERALDDARKALGH